MTNSARRVDDREKSSAVHGGAWMCKASVPPLLRSIEQGTHCQLPVLPPRVAALRMLSGCDLQEADRAMIR